MSEAEIEAKRQEIARLANSLSNAFGGLAFACLKDARAGVRGDHSGILSEVLTAIEAHAKAQKQLARLMVGG